MFWQLVWAHNLPSVLILRYQEINRGGKNDCIVNSVYWRVWLFWKTPLSSCCHQVSQIVELIFLIKLTEKKCHAESCWSALSIETISIKISLDRRVLLQIIDIKKSFPLRLERFLDSIAKLKWKLINTDSGLPKVQTNDAINDIEEMSF